MVFPLLPHYHFFLSLHLWLHGMFSKSNWLDSNQHNMTAPATSGLQQHYRPTWGWPWGSTKGNLPGGRILSILSCWPLCLKGEMRCRYHQLMVISWQCSSAAKTWKDQECKSGDKDVQRKRYLWDLWEWIQSMRIFGSLWMPPKGLHWRGSAQ